MAIWQSLRVRIKLSFAMTFYGWHLPLPPPPPTTRKNNQTKPKQDHTHESQMQSKANSSGYIMTTVYSRHKNALPRTNDVNQNVKKEKIKEKTSSFTEKWWLQLTVHVILWVASWNLLSQFPQVLRYLCLCCCYCWRVAFSPQKP